jgi:hypothetical protein
MNPYAPPSAPIGHGPGVHSITPGRAEELRRRLAGYNKMSFALAIPGFVLQGIGRNIGDVTGTLLTLVGAGLFIGGLFFYTKMRGQHPALCLVGLFSCLGMLVLYFLPKRCLNCATSASYGAKQCAACGAPLGA